MPLSAKRGSLSRNALGESSVSATLERAIRLWKYRVIYCDVRGYYRWSKRAALPPGARSGRIARPYSEALRQHFSTPAGILRTPLQLSLEAQ